MREGAGLVQLTVTAELDASPEPEDTVLTLSLRDGTAQVSDDFEAMDDVTLTIWAGQSSGTAQVTLAPVDDDVDEDDETVRITVVNATSGSSLQVDPPLLEVTIEDDDTRGVTVTPTTLTVLEGESTSYAVRLTSRPTGPVTVRPDVTTSMGTRTVTVAASSSLLTFTESNWREAQTVWLSAANDDIAHEQDTEATVAHTVSGADYGSEMAPDVTVTVRGLSVVVDETVRFVVPATGDPVVVVVPAGTPVPAGTRVTLPSGLGGTIEIGMVAENDPALADPPQGFRAGDAVVDITPSVPLPPGQTATVCLPASSRSQRVHRYDELLEPPAWVELDPPPGGSPADLVLRRDRLLLVVRPRLVAERDGGEPVAGKVRTHGRRPSGRCPDRPVRRWC